MANDDVNQQNVIKPKLGNEAQVHIETNVKGSRRSHTERKSALDALASDYVVCLQELNFNIGEISYPISLKQVIESIYSQQWKYVIVAELKSM